MSHNNTVFSQMIKLVPRHEFEKLANHHHLGQRLRQTSRWSQFVSLCPGQLSGRQSLRDIESNMKAQSQRLYVMSSLATILNKAHRLLLKFIRTAGKLSYSSNGSSKT